MTVDVQLWIEDLSSNEPRMTYRHGGTLDRMPTEDEPVALAGDLHKLFRNLRFEADHKQQIAWFYAEAYEWEPELEQAVYAAGYTNAGTVESFENGGTW